jgi:hypothetical protein
MKWIKRLYSKTHKQLQEPEFQDKLGMHLEVRKAHMEWQAAHKNLDWAVGRDQIDYAIFALEAAEKRYEMLLRQAKQVGWEDGLVVASQAQKLHMEWSKEASAKANNGKAAGY